MDAFEQLVAEFFGMEGQWVRTSVKVELTKAEKRQIGRPSAPRWPLDIIAYHARDNLLRVIECKSYLDSNGVNASAFDGSNPSFSKRFKLFHEPNLRRVVFNRLRVQFTETGACRKNPKIRLCLACGKISEDSRTWLQQHFQKQGWELLDETWLKERLQRIARGGYENQVSVVVAKLLLRGRVE